MKKEKIVFMDSLEGKIKCKRCGQEMKKFIIEISHTEYAKIQVEAKSVHMAESLVPKNIDCADWGNDETEILDVKELE